MEAASFEADGDALPSVDASKLLVVVTDTAYEDLFTLLSTLRLETLDRRREALLQYVRTQRARFLQAYAVLRWLSDRPGLVPGAKRALAAAQEHTASVEAAQGRLYHMHGGFFGARQPRADLPTALAMLTGAGYVGLPAGIRNCGALADPTPLVRLPRQRKPPAELSPEAEAAAAAAGAAERDLAAQVGRCIKRTMAWREPLPAGFAAARLERGRLRLEAPGRFALVVTLDSCALNAPWLALSVDVSVATRPGDAAAAGAMAAGVPAMDDRHAAYLLGVVQRGMDAAPERPLSQAYSICQDFCASLQLATLEAQARALAQRNVGAWGGVLEVRRSGGSSSRLLDICFWPKEYRTALGPTGLDAGAANVVTLGASSGADAAAASASRPAMAVTAAQEPTACRFLRIFVDESGVVRSRVGPLADLEGVGGVSVADLVAGSVELRPDAISCQLALLSAVRALARLKLLLVEQDLSAALETAGLQLRAQVLRTSSGDSVRVWAGGPLLPATTALDNGRPREAVAAAALAGASNSGLRWPAYADVAVDVCSGRFVVRSREHYTSATKRALARVQEALNRAPAAAPAVGAVAGTSGAGPGGSICERREALSARLREALRLLLVEEVEAGMRCRLGLKPQRRWHAVLGRASAGVRGSAAVAAADPSGDGSSAADHAATYAAVSEVYEFGGRGAAAGPMPAAAAPSSSVGSGTAARPREEVPSGRQRTFTAPQPGPEQLRWFLELVIDRELDLQASLLLVSEPVSNGSLRPTLVSSRNIDVDAFRTATGRGGASSTLYAAEAASKSTSAALAGKERSFGGQVWLAQAQQHNGFANDGPAVEAAAAAKANRTCGVAGAMTAGGPRANGTHGKRRIGESPAFHGGDDALEWVVEAALALVPYSRLCRAIERAGLGPADGRGVSGSSLDLLQDSPSADYCTWPPRWRQVVVPAGWRCRPLCVTTAWVQPAAACVAGARRGDAWEWKLLLASGTQLRQPLLPQTVVLPPTNMADNTSTGSNCCSSSSSSDGGDTAMLDELWPALRSARVCASARGLTLSLTLRHLPASLAWLTARFPEAAAAMAPFAAQAAVLAARPLPPLGKLSLGEYQVAAAGPLHVLLAFKGGVRGGFGEGSCVLVTHASVARERPQQTLALLPGGGPPPLCLPAVAELEAMASSFCDLASLVSTMSLVFMPLAALGQRLPGLVAGGPSSGSSGSSASALPRFKLRAHAPARYRLELDEGMGRGALPLLFLPTGKVRLGPRECDVPEFLQLAVHMASQYAAKRKRE